VQFLAYPRAVPLRRRAPEAEPAAPALAEPPKPGGKGRPTPKRREVEQRRRTPVTAPKTRKEAYKNRREQVRAERAEMRGALRRGDERNLPPRDAGPARRLARDIVDARRSLAGLFMPLAFVAVAVSGVRVPSVAIAANIFMLSALVAVFVDSWWLGRQVRARVVEKYGEKEAHGIRMYAVMRASTIRRMRLPPPKVNRGDKV
jgi:hypothetical protein